MNDDSNDDTVRSSIAPALTSAAATTAASDTRIIGGDTVVANAAGSQPYPYYVQLRVFTGGSTTQFICGGCIVHAWQRNVEQQIPNAGLWILTAAHCLDPSSEIAINVFVGGVSEGTGISQLAFVSATRNAAGWKQYGPGGIRVFSHPLHGQDPMPHAHDIALIRVILPATEPLPPTLVSGAPSSSMINWTLIPSMNTNPTLRNAAAEVMGFGKTSRDPEAPASSTLQRADVMIEPSNFSWRQSPSDEPYLTWVIGTKVLTQNETVSTCNGDSGGPLVASGGSGSVVVGPLCCGYCAQPLVSDLRDVPSFYTRAANYLDPPTTPPFANGLPSDSLFRKGLVAIINDYSPTQLRSDTVTNADYAAKADADSATNVWSAGAAKRTLFDWIVIWSALLFNYDIVRWILVGVAGFLLLYMVYSVLRRKRARAAATKRTGSLVESAPPSIIRT